MAESIFDRVFRNSIPEPNSGCLIWTGGLSNRGYALMCVYDKGPKTVSVHRRIYKEGHGEIPTGLVIAHKCHVKCCVNLEHLTAVSQSANMMMSDYAPSTKNAAKTHCVHGHPLSGENLYLTPKGKRECKECRRAAKKRHVSRG